VLLRRPAPAPFVNHEDENGPHARAVLCVRVWRPEAGAVCAYSSFFSGEMAWNVGLLKTLSRQAPLSWSLAFPTE